MKKNKILFLVVLVFSFFVLTSCYEDCLHEESDWIIDVQPTCQKTGLKHTVCINCYRKLEEKVIEKLDHALIRHEGKEVTCTEAGYQTYDTCENCDYTTFKEIEAKGHTLIHHEGKEVTCTEAGYQAYDTCENCEYTTYEEIEAKGHELVHHEGKEATCTTLGHNEYDECKNCDYTTYEEIIIDHNYVDYVCTMCFESLQDNLIYELASNEIGYYVTGMHNPQAEITKIVIPDEYEGKPVIGVDLNVFTSLVNLTSLQLSDNISYLEGNLGDSNICNQFDNGYYLGSSNNPYLVLVKPTTKTLESILINKNTKIISSYALYDCNNLKVVSLEEGSQLITINKAAFYKCTSLTRITLPFIGGSAESNRYLGYIFGASAYSQNINFVPNSLKEINILEGCTSIGFNAFFKCEKIESINLPSTLQTIAAGAFNHCLNLENITIPSNVTSIGFSIFNDCKSLKSIVVPDKVTYIPESAFYQCISLENIVFPTTIEIIEKGALSGCTNLKSMTLPFVGGTQNAEGTNGMLAYLFGGGKYYSDNSKYVPTTLKEVIILEGCTLIGQYAFSSCSSIESITIPSTVTTIKQCVFSSCTNLKNITMLANVTKFDQKLFSNCTSLTTITIPSSVTSIELDTFKNCLSLESIIVDENNTTFTTIDGSLYTKDETKLIKYALGKKDSDFTIPSTVTSIESLAFSSTPYLKNLIIPSSVTTIVEKAFENCTSIESVTISSGLTTIEMCAFWQCTNLKSINIPSSVKTIGNWVFCRCTSLETIIIPSSVEFIGEYAFYQCDKITIYCECESQPNEWNENWNISDRPVYWGVKNN